MGIAIHGPVEQIRGVTGGGHLGQHQVTPAAGPHVVELHPGHEDGEIIDALLDLAGDPGPLGHVELDVVGVDQGVQLLVGHVEQVVGLGLVGVVGVERLPVLRVETAAAPAEPGRLVLLLQHHLEAGGAIHQVELQIQARLLGLFLEHGQPLGVLLAGVGEGKRQSLALVILQDAVRPRLVVAAPGEVLPRLGDVIGPLRQLDVGEFAKARAEGGGPVIIAVQHGRYHLVQVHGVLDAEAHIHVRQLGVADVEVHPLPPLLGVCHGHHLLHIALLVFRGHGFFMPPVGQYHLEGIQLPLEEVTERYVVIPDHLHLDAVDVESVLVVAILLGPPILLLAEGDGLALLHLAHHIGASGRHHSPVVLLHPVRPHLVVVLRLGPQLRGVEQVQPGLAAARLHQDGVIVDLLHRHHLCGVVVVEPGPLDVLGAHHLVAEGVVVGGDRLAVRPFGAGIQLEVDGLAVRCYGPGARQRGNGVAGVGVEADEPQLVVQDEGAERAVGVGPHGAKRQRKAVDEEVEGATGQRLGGGEGGVGVVGLPLEIRRQAGGPHPGSVHQQKKRTYPFDFIFHV
ncbi:hypothetical protein D3C76_568670 [compost metagenome]